MKNISEPVLTILKLLDDNPDRFTIKPDFGYAYTALDVTDNDTGLGFRAITQPEVEGVIGGLAWLTEDEMDVLAKKVFDVYYRYTDKLKEEDRKKWSDVYKNQ